MAGRHRISALCQLDVAVSDYRRRVGKLCAEPGSGIVDEKTLALCQDLNFGCHWRLVRQCELLTTQVIRIFGFDTARGAMRPSDNRNDTCSFGRVSKSEQRE